MEFVQIAMLLLSHGMDLSHELIAATAGINVKVVYGHIPDRAALVVELEKQLQEVIPDHFPAKEEDIVPLGRKAFRSFNANAPLVRGVITAAASARRSNLPSPEARTAFIASLRPLLEDIPPRKRKAVIGCFVAVFSAPFWNLLRSRAELSSDEAEEAAVWMLTTLLDSLQIGASSQPFLPSDRAPQKAADNYRFYPEV